VPFIRLPIQTPSVATLNHVTIPWSSDIGRGRSGLMIEPIGVGRTGWAHSFILEIEAASASETIVLMYHIVWNRISVHRHFHVLRRENLKSHEWCKFLPSSMCNIYEKALWFLKSPTSRFWQIYTFLALPDYEKVVFEMASASLTLYMYVPLASAWTFGHILFIFHA
jgi:hypothetical protein